MRTYTPKPGGPYRTRSHHSTSACSNQRAASASSAGRIPVIRTSLQQDLKPTTGSLGRKSQPAMHTRHFGIVHAARSTNPRSASDRATVPGMTVGAQWQVSLHARKVCAA